MKSLLAIIFLLGCSTAFAGHVKLSWNNSEQSPGEAFRVYWFVKNSDQKGLVDLGRLQPKAPGSKYDMMLASEEWKAGQEVCFKMSAYNIGAQILESDMSNAACKVMPVNGSIVPRD